jgi:hypothetical protein
MESKEELERLGRELCSESTREEYKALYEAYPVSFFPRMLGNLLVWSGNLVYGKKPTYLKFRAVEVIARVPYQSWVSAAYTLFTLFYSNEKKALELSNVTQFARLAQDNETMHVVVISQLAKQEYRAGAIRYTLIPMLFAFFYFWASYTLYLINKRYSMELNYCFENHAFLQYSEFLLENAEELKNKPITSEFLAWYGRTPRSQYEFFESVRNDELIHRNMSVHSLQTS